MTTHSEPTPAAWPPEAVKAFTTLCQNEGLNPVRLRKLIDQTTLTGRNPSRQELIDSLKHKPRIQERAAKLKIITPKLITFLNIHVRTL
jgi:hypothetical protein